MPTPKAKDLTIDSSPPPLPSAEKEASISSSVEAAKDESAKSSTPTATESNFMSGWNKRLSFLSKESKTIFEQVSAASLVAREKAAVLAEEGLKLASQKYSELVEEKAKTAGPTEGRRASVESSSNFVIDDDDEEENDREGDTGLEDISGIKDLSMSAEEEERHRRKAALEAVDPQRINVSRTELEKVYALAMHTLAGLRPGDSLLISKDTLPGATLFPAMIYSPRRASIASSSSLPLPAPDTTTSTDAASQEESAQQGEEKGDGAALDGESKARGSVSKEDIHGDGEELLHPEHRFLVVTKERFLVLDTKGGAVGSTGIVQINKHLTEVILFLFVSSRCLISCL